MPNPTTKPSECIVEQVHYDPSSKCITIRRAPDEYGRILIALDLQDDLESASGTYSSPYPSPDQNQIWLVIRRGHSIGLSASARLVQAVALFMIVILPPRLMITLAARPDHSAPNTTPYSPLLCPIRHALLPGTCSALLHPRTQNREPMTEKKYRRRTPTMMRSGVRLASMRARGGDFASCISFPMRSGFSVSRRNCATGGCNADGRAGGALCWRPTEPTLEPWKNPTRPTHPHPHPHLSPLSCSQWRRFVWPGPGWLPSDAAAPSLTPLLLRKRNGKRVHYLLLGTREPLDPGFEWPFGDCVANTSDTNPITAILVPSFIDISMTPHVLSASESVRFREVFLADREAVHLMQRDERWTQIKEERRTAGLSRLSDPGSTCGRWTSFSPKSVQTPCVLREYCTRIVDLSAAVCYDFSGPERFGTLDGWQEERRTIFRLLTRFSDPLTERAIRWALNEQPAGLISTLQEDVVPDLTCTPLVELASSLVRPPSPDDARVSQSHTADGGDVDVVNVVEDWSDGDGEWYDDSDEDLDDMPKIYIRRPAPPPPRPNLGIPEVKVMYFDVHDTLIDKEQGVFEALSPLLHRSPYEFDRNEAVSFYLESELEIKKRTPAAPYTHVDHASLHRNPTFADLSSYFDTVFTTDACAAYKPAPAIFDGAVRHYDALYPKRENICIVSASLLLDLEPARALGIPGIWMRYAQSLAEHVEPWERAFPALMAFGLYDLAEYLVSEVFAFADDLPHEQRWVDTAGNPRADDLSPPLSASCVDPKPPNSEVPNPKESSSENPPTSSAEDG
ncbi:hypothetical protein MSAN_00554500 [Mycena sanguinolenta]|uniref:Uncharacterized protein n=1 Tax=Mycena sanguinolenta TaxID=230812 RepID=A0A8H6Z6Y0_9AGAR|nr:hypothetical protein MSAN_00554500 [Mycena sanguinolenta]